MVLLASIGFSFGFVLQRGGLELSGFQSPSQSAGASRPVPSATTAAVAASHAAFGPGVSISPLPAATEIATAGPTATPPPPTPGPTVAPTPGHSPSPTPGPSLSPSPVPTPSASAVATPVATPAVTTGRADAAAHGDAPTHERPVRRDHQVPRAERLLDLHVRTGDNLFSIAHWFGVSLDRDLDAMNPWARTRGIHPGNDLLIRRRPADGAPPSRPRDARATAREHPDCSDPARARTSRSPRATAGDVTSAVTRGVSNGIATAEDLAPPSRRRDTAGDVTSAETGAASSGHRYGEPAGGDRTH